MNASVVSRLPKRLRFNWMNDGRNAFSKIGQWRKYRNRYKQRKIVRVQLWRVSTSNSDVHDLAWPRKEYQWKECLTDILKCRVNSRSLFSPVGDKIFTWISMVCRMNRIGFCLGSGSLLYAGKYLEHMCKSTTKSFVSRIYTIK